MNMKKHCIYIAACILLTCCITGNLHASKPLLAEPSTPNDSTVNVIKLKVLTVRESALQKQIQEEDKKRNAIYNGASSETTEALNNRQDSICLDLRSQLIDVQLEIKEIKRNNLLQTISTLKIKDNK